MQMRQAVVAYSPPSDYSNAYVDFSGYKLLYCIHPVNHFKSQIYGFVETLYTMFTKFKVGLLLHFCYSLFLSITFYKWILVIICLHSFLYKLSHTTIFLRLGATLELTRVIYRNITNQVPLPLYHIKPTLLSFV